jgi:hypothetical protein
MNLLITNKRTLVTIFGDEHYFAKLTDLDPEQVIWAIEGYSRCDANRPGGDEYVAILLEFPQ